MKYFVQFYSQTANEENVPENCIAHVNQVEDDVVCPENWTEMTSQEYSDYKDSHHEEFDAWLMEQQLKTHIHNLQQDVDRTTTELIEGGMLYPPLPREDGIIIRLTLENQFDFKAECDMRDYLTFPHKIKGKGLNYWYLQSADEYLQFYILGMKFVRVILEFGWMLKGQIGSFTSLQEVVEFNDPRENIDGVFYYNGAPYPPIPSSSSSSASSVSLTSSSTNSQSSSSSN